MPDYDLSSWVNSVFSSMSIGAEPFFKQLWEKGKLKYSGDGGEIDIIDKSNAKIICTALDTKQHSLVILPDDKKHRGVIAFTTALLRSALHCINLQQRNHKVLYFGTSLAFKHTFGKIVVKNIPIQSVFKYTQVEQAAPSRSGKDINTYLPEVICVYHPVRPEEFIKLYNPDWIAIDCSKENELPWLDDLLKYCKEHNVAVVGWSQNPFSSVANVFKRYGGKIFYSPKKLKVSADEDIGKLFINSDTCEIEPQIFTEQNGGTIDRMFQQAKELLKGLAKTTNSILKQDALKASWLLLRAIERLCVPVSIYNAEAKVFKYVYPFDSLAATIERYGQILNTTDAEFSVRLSEFQKLCKDLVDHFSQTTPPYWAALSDYCTDRSEPGVLRVLVFPKRHQKQFFAYTLLADFNIKEDELFDDSKIMLRTLKEFANPNGKDAELYQGYEVLPIIAGLPDFYNRHFIYQILNKQNIDILIFPHQYSVLNSILNDFNRTELEQRNTSLQTLGHFGKETIVQQFSDFKRYQFSKKSTSIKVDNNKVSKSSGESDAKLLEIGDLQSELSKILEAGEVDEEEAAYLLDLDVLSRGSAGNAPGEGILVEKYLQISLEDSNVLFVELDEEVSVIRDNKVAKIFVQALRKGDRVLLIENQSRQSLYNLIIARVNNHPSLELHLGMINKWRSDFYLGYSKWRASEPNNGPETFLQLLQGKGSRITSPATVNNWVNGHVLRPQDQLDIKRIGEILDLKFLKNNYQKIDAAAQRIVGIHISLSHKLNNWIESRTSHTKRNDADLVDQELGLTFGELRSSIRILKVLEMLQVNEPISQNRLGKLHRI